MDIADWRTKIDDLDKRLKAGEKFDAARTAAKQIEFRAQGFRPGMDHQDLRSGNASPCLADQNAARQ